MSCPSGGHGLGWQVATTALGVGGRRVACMGAGMGTTGPPPTRPGVSGRRQCPIKQAAFPITAAGAEAAQLHLCGPARLCPLGDQCPGGFLHHTLAFSPYLWPHGTGACFSAPDWALGSRKEAMSWVLELPSPRGGSRSQCASFHHEASWWALVMAAFSWPWSPRPAGLPVSSWFPGAWH